MTKTYNEIQLDLQECFNKLSDVGVKLVTAKNQQVAQLKALVGLEDETNRAKEEYNKVIKNDVVNLKVFEYLKGAKESGEASIEKAKIAKLLIEDNIAKLTKEQEELTAEYASIEKRLKNYKNVIKLEV